MPDQLQLRGGTTAEHSTFTGASKEVTVDTTKKTLVVHDGATVGGTPLAKQDLSNVTAGAIPGTLAVTGAITGSSTITSAAGTATGTGIQVGTGTTYKPGIYSPGADQVAIATGGTSRIVVDASGNVNIDNNTFYVDAATNCVGLGNTTGLGGLLGVSGNISLSGDGTSARYVALLNETSTYAGSFILQAGGGSSGYGGAITMYGHSHASYPGSIYLGTSASSGGSLIFGTDNALDPASGKMRLDSSGRLLVGTSSNSGGALFQVNDNRIRIATANTPASAGATGTTGEIAWDANYIYVCTATNTWKRTAISTW